ncbi:SURF1 family protein [Caldimonas tepidiphila]|uniref:SURF1 family protein n=1 Tax=Caldimonas tepidiphila TaxID=2315841 RepID=UPI003012A981
MSDADIRGPRRPATLAAMLSIAALLFLGFVALGMWQVQRLAWKQDLIARIERHQQAAPVPAPGPADWPGLSRAEDEYRRVQVRGRFAHELETLVQANTVLGSGFWVLTPLRSEDGFWVLVNRGFVPPERRERASRGEEPAAEQEVSGLLRLTEPGGRLLQDNDPAAGRWYSRDVQAIAAARGLGGAERAGAVAPYFIDAAADAAAAEAWPRPGLTVLRFSNSHLVYALTWFALALMVAAATAYLLREERQLRRDAGDAERGGARD